MSARAPRRFSRRGWVVMVVAIGLAVAIPVLALVYDIRDPGEVQSVNGAIVYRTSIKSAGSGNIDSFLVVGDNDTDKQGYNTGGTFEYNELTGTDPLPLTSIPQVTINGVVYREFVLDLNEDLDKNITLQKLQLFTATNPNLTGYAAAPPGIGGGTTLIWDLDQGTDNELLLDDYASGSGAIDYAFYVPDSLFGGGATCDYGNPFGGAGECLTYIYMFNLFTGIGDGYEEWGVGADAPVVASQTATNTLTNTPVIPTGTATNTPTNTPAVPTDTATSTPTNTPAVPTDTATSTPTNTPVVPTDTATSTPTNTPVAPTNTATPTDTVTPTDTATPTNTPGPDINPDTCPAGAGYELTDMLGKGLGSNTINRNGARVDIPTNQDVIELYGQIAGKNQRTWKYARFIRPNGTYINDKTLESPAYRQHAVFWYGQQLTPANLAYWKGRLIGTPTNGPFVQRAFVLYPTYQTADLTVNVWELFENSAENMVYWDVANGWVPVQTITVPIPAPLQPAQLTVKVALVDNDPDARPVYLTVSASGDSETVIQDNSTHGPLLSIVTVTLDVTVGASEIVLRLESPDQIADSVAMIGMTAHYACPQTP